MSNSSTFNTQNPEAPIFAGQEIQITVLGGVKLGGLDKLRVTLKVEHEDNPPIRQNLDLYHSNQVTKLVEQIAGLYGLPTESIQQTIEQLTSDLEAWRMNQLELLSKPKQEQPTLTATEKTKATKWLKAPKLMERTQDLLGQAGMVGEETNRLLLWLVMSSRKTARPLHAVSLASSGTGKTHLQQTLAGLLPPEDVLEVTSLSGNALYYFKGDELRHKLLLIEDLDGVGNLAAGGSGALYPLRELQSKGRLSKTVAVKGPRGTLRTEILEVEGPVSVAAATTKETIYTDNANRALLLTLDESAEQDQRILDYQRKRASGAINRKQQHEARELLQATQRCLEAVEIQNPFAESLQLPSQVYTQRRANQLYLDLINAITFYHQHQRRRTTGDGGRTIVETAPEDIEWANQLAAPVLLKKSDELSGACRSFFEELKFHLKRNKLESFTSHEIRKPLRIPYSTLKRYLLQLRQYGLLEVAGGDRKNGFCYQITEPGEYDQLKHGVQTALEEALNKLLKQGKGEVAKSSSVK